MQRPKGRGFNRISDIRNIFEASGISIPDSAQNSKNSEASKTLGSCSRAKAGGVQGFSQCQAGFAD